MVNIIRRFQQPLLITITVLVIVSFIWLFNKNNVTDRYAAINAATIYGRPVSMNRLHRGGSFFQLAQGLRLQDLVAGLVGREMMIGAMFGQVSKERVAEEFSFNEYILQHEANALGIQPTNDDIFEATKEVPGFQTNGAFDSAKYNQIVSTILPSLGMTENDLEEVVGDQLRVRMLKELVSNSIQPTSGEIRANYEERSRKMDVSVIRVKLDDFKAAVQVTDDDVKKLFEERKATLKTPEKRKVKFVAFALDAAKPPTGPERVETLQKLADQAGAFSAAMTEKNADFDALAAKNEVKVQTTEDFAESEPPAGLDEKTAEAAFSLTKEQPNSDAVLLQKNDGYAVLQLVDITPSRPLTFEEAKAQLTEQLKQDRAQEAMNLKATEIRNKIDADLKGGKSFAEAAQAAGAKAEKFPTFSRSGREGAKEPDANSIVSAATDLQEGQLSAFIPTETGGLILHMDKLLPIDEADFDKQKPMLAKELASQESEAIFDGWFKQCRKEANIH